ncbi:putative RNA-directed DNA polymerase [Tanacetum coccineum]
MAAISLRVLVWEAIPYLSFTRLIYLMLCSRFVSTCRSSEPHFSALKRFVMGWDAPLQTYGLIPPVIVFFLAPIYLRGIQKRQVNSFPHSNAEIVAKTKPISPAPPTDSEYLRSGMRYMIHNEVACLMLGSKGKANGKGKDKQVYIPKPKNPKPYAKEHPAKDNTCHHCKEVGHCKRNYPAYLAELIKKKKKVGTTTSSDVFIIELFSFSTKSWVYDTSCGTHICNTKHGLGGVRKLKQVEAIGSFDLVLPNGLVICLDNCHYGPSITRGVVSVYRLVENGFVHTKRVKHYLDSTYLWHCHLAHINKKRIEKLQQEGLLKSTDDESFDQCVSCLSGKMTRKSFPHRPERVTDLLGIIHTDVCGPLRHVSRQGASYFITFTDDYSRYGYVYLLKHKHEVFETFKVFKNEVENQLGKTIKAIRSDRGGEYISQEFKDYLKANGIVQQLTPPYTPQHNGVSERRNRTLLDMVRSMMNLTTLPLSFWDYALESATRILNMVPTKKVDKTPYEMWYGKVPNLSYLKVWGCEALVKRDTPDKLEQRSVKCIFIGYPKETMGYYFYFPPENKIVVARYAEFFEKRLISQEISGRAVDLEEIQEQEDTSPSEITSNIPQEVEGFGPPPQEEEILIHSESNKWIDVMNAKIQSMMDNMVWVLVDLPPGCKTIKIKWLFKKKTDMDGIGYTFYKACFVAKGYTQLYEVDYEETFSPVADIKAIRVLISIAAYYDYEIWQMDVKTAFLNGYLDEDIYMVQPEASRRWNKRFDEEIKRFGFSQNLDESCVYQKASGSNVTFLILYVDDIIIMGNHIPSLQSVKNYLGKCFSMKDLGEAAFILEIKIYKDISKRLIGLSQNAYMGKILKRYKMDNSKHGHIRMQERLDLNKSQGAQRPKEPISTGELHSTAVKNILKYLRNTKDMFLVYGGNPSTELRVECYCDVGFENDRDDTKSQIGYVFILNGGAVDWKSSGTDNQEKDEKQRQNDKTGTDGKTVKDKQINAGMSIQSKVNRLKSMSKSKSNPSQPRGQSQWKYKFRAEIANPKTYL